MKSTMGMGEEPSSLVILFLPKAVQIARVLHNTLDPPAPQTLASLFDRWLFALLVTLFYGVEGSIYLPQKLYGEVTSPLYPKPYPSDLETTTVITVPMGYRVKLVFWQFDVEPSEGCFYDYVKVGVRVGGRGNKTGSLCSEYSGQYACTPSLYSSVEMLVLGRWCHRGGIRGLLRPSVRFMRKRGRHGGVCSSRFHYVLELGHS